jgi:hypothetical protein
LFCEKNLGGAGADLNYSGGMTGDPKDKRATLQRVRQTLQEKMTAFTRFCVSICIYDCF